MRARFQGHCDRDRATAIYVVISSVCTALLRETVTEKCINHLQPQRGLRCGFLCI